jgi:uncharacterized membrane protein
MPIDQSKKAFGFLKTTAIGGLLFLLPLIVLGALIGQVVPIVLSVAETLGEFIPFRTPGGIALLILLAIVVILLLCFAAGLVARWSLGKRVSQNLLLLFPRYAILKDQMADTIGGDQTKPKMKPVVVTFDEYTRIGFETERENEGSRVVVFLPGSPDPWAGKTVLIAADRVAPLAAEFGEATGCCEQLGRGSLALLTRTAHAETG